jgi:IS30 family transposase
LPRAAAHLEKLKPLVLRLLKAGYSRQQAFNFLVVQQAARCSRATFYRWVRAEFGDASMAAPSPIRWKPTDAAHTSVDNAKSVRPLSIYSSLDKPFQSSISLQSGGSDAREKMNVFDEVLEELRAKDMGAVASQVLRETGDR